MALSGPRPWFGHRRRRSRGKVYSHSEAPRGWKPNSFCAKSGASFGKASHDHRAFQTKHAAHLRERCRRFCPEMNDVSREGAVKAVISEGQRISRSQMKARLARGRQAGIEVGCFGDRFSQRPRPGDVRFAPTRPNFCSFPGSQRSAYFVSFQSIPPPAASSLLKCRRSVGPC